MTSAWSPITRNCCLLGCMGPSILSAIGFWHWICEMITITTKAPTQWDACTAAGLAPAELGRQRRGKATWGPWITPGKGSRHLDLPWGEGDTYAKGRGGKKSLQRLCKCRGMDQDKVQKTRREAGRQSQDTGRETNWSHLINSQAIYPCRAGEITTLWMQNLWQQQWGSVICMSALIALL